MFMVVEAGAAEGTTRITHNSIKTGLLDQYDRELEVAYRGELYRVRDNFLDGWIERW